MSLAEATRWNEETAEQAELLERIAVECGTMTAEGVRIGIRSVSERLGLAPSALRGGEPRRIVNLHRWRQSRRRKAAEGKAPVANPNPARRTLMPYVDEYLTLRRRQGRMTRETARNTGYRLGQLSDKFGRRPITHFTSAFIERWLADLESLAPSTRRLAIQEVRGFCGWLVRRHVIADDPTADVPLPRVRRVPRALNGEDARRLLDYARGVDDPRALPIVALMLYCGLRCIEVSRLNVTDYDARDGTLFLTGKGQHERMVPVPAAAARIFDRYLRESGGLISGPFIRSRRVEDYTSSQGLTANTISALVATWFWEAGIKENIYDGRAAHALRHTAASDVLDQCGDLRAVQQMLGHVHLTTTEVYLRRASLGTLREAMEGRDYEASQSYESVSFS